MPKSGDDFIVMEDEDLIKNVLLMRDNAWQIKHLQEQESLASILNKEKIHLLLKTDTAASLEALKAAVLSLSSKFIIKIFSENVGDIILSDVEKAIEFDLKIIGFNVKIENVAKKLIKNENIKCINNNIIYRILEEMELLTQKTEIITTETKVGVFEVRHLFTFNKTVIAGGKVLEGSIFHSNHYICEIFRKNVSIYKNHISSMKKGKDNMKEAKQDIEVGIMFDNFHKIEVNDKIICYKIVTETKIIE
jgi:translation initiation factor IF-2